MANNRRRLVGRVVSDKMEKTVTVALERRKIHPIYKKVVRTTKKVMAHDESNAIEVGAIVRIVESKPMSKNKRWVVEEVLATGHVDFVASEVETDVPASVITSVPDVEADADIEPEVVAETAVVEAPAETEVVVEAAANTEPEVVAASEPEAGEVPAEDGGAKDEEEQKS